MSEMEEEELDGIPKKYRARRIEETWPASTDSCYPNGSRQIIF